MGCAPGPGAYNTIPVTGTSASKYSMRLKTAVLNENVTSKIVPGPGQYFIPAAISADGKQMYAKYKSSAAALFSPPSSKRFREISTFD